MKGIYKRRVHTVCTGTCSVGTPSRGIGSSGITKDELLSVV
jgi:hypothetical protein